MKEDVSQTRQSNSSPQAIFYLPFADWPAKLRTLYVGHFNSSNVVP